MKSKTPHILVVEDSEDYRFLLSKAFESVKSCRFTHTMVENGLEAQRYLRGEDRFRDRHQFPVPLFVLSDLKMPMCDGLELLAWIRNHAATPQLPVVMLTSSQESSDVAHAYGLGANTFFAKPSSFVGLLELVDNFTEYWCEFAVVPK
jgi:CheY-like chemotaxis protein